MLPALPVVLMWPLVVLLFFKQCTPTVALCWSIIAGYLFLPEGIGLDLPFIPPINKHTLPALAVLLCLWAFGAQSRGSGREMAQQATMHALPGWLPRNGLCRVLLIFLFAGLVLTALTNGERLVIGNRALPGIRPYDILSGTTTTILGLLPFFLARKYLATPQGHKTLLTVLCIAGILYSFLALYEVRMSPRLNVNLYGFFPHSWVQHLRAGGFRPIVFLQHGLWLGAFFASTVLASLALFRFAPADRKYLYLGAALWLFGTLFLSKTLGSFLIVLVLAPIVLLMSVRLQLIAAASICAVVILYPMLRSVDIIPVDKAIELAADINPDRADSLRFRIYNEDLLLAKAREKPLFGWGGYARARVYSESGSDTTTTDGHWIIVMGENGWVGYIAYFGLLCLPVILLALRKGRYNLGYETSGLCLILTANVIDLIPNASLTVVTWLVAGALVGRLEVSSSEAENPSYEDGPQDMRRLVYSRHPPRHVRPGLTAAHRAPVHARARSRPQTPEY